MSLKVALVGAGHMGRIHLEKLAGFDDVEIVGVVDIDREKALELAQRYEVPAYRDHREVLTHTDAVIIATPTESHHRIAVDFVKSGSHVLIEKPIAATLEEARDLVNLGRQSGVILQVGFLERFNPAFMQSLSFIRKPLIIEARRASEFTGRSVDIDVVLDLMIHDIDLILSFVREDVCDVQAHGFSFVTDKLDMACARLTFGGGCVASLHANRISSRKERSLAIYQKDRHLFVDLLNRRVVVTTKDDGGIVRSDEYFSDQGDAVKEELKAFVQSVSSGTPPSAQGEDGLIALAIAERIKQHIAEQQPS